MIALIQRVSQASVTVDSIVRGSIDRGLLVLLGVADTDDHEDVNWLSRKVVNLRIFNDDQNVMNHSLLETGGELLVVSQFTLQASTKKGNRPSYVRAAKPEVAIPLYEQFVSACQAQLGKPVETGEFGADMQVSLVNNGPVTIIIDTQDKR
jgi:D-tyrosyl-tRNA(Tyr) deacylase